jgi:transcriptional regulator with XRE-family HTH domain
MGYGKEDELESCFAVLGKNVRKFREEIGLSTEQVAKIVGISSERMTQIEEGTKVLGLDVIFELADVLGGRPTSELLEGARLLEDLFEMGQRYGFSYLESVLHVLNRSGEMNPIGHGA